MEGYLISQKSFNSDEQILDIELWFSRFGYLLLYTYTACSTLSRWYCSAESCPSASILAPWKFSILVRLISHCNESEKTKESVISNYYSWVKILCIYKELDTFAKITCTKISVKHWRLKTSFYFWILTSRLGAFKHNIYEHFNQRIIQRQYLFRCICCYFELLRAAKFEQ